MTYDVIACGCYIITYLHTYMHGRPQVGRARGGPCLPWKLKNMGAPQG